VTNIKQEAGVRHPRVKSKMPVESRLPSIFISYRRSDTPDAVGRIYDRLVSEFGKARVFKDVDSIPLGQDFRGHLNEVVGGCAAVLAIIGPRWTDARNNAGQRRLEDADDFVRIELEAALARNIPVVPVLVGHASMPATTDLTGSLASMVFRQSIEVRPDPDFHNDATRLVSALRMMLDPNAPQLESSPGVKVNGGRSLGCKIAFGMAILVAAALAIPALKYLRLSPPAETRTEISAPGHVRAGANFDGSIALSPDGRQIVFAETNNGVSNLWLRALAATTARPLPGTDGATYPFWSPDSRSIGFFTVDALKRLDVGGGAPLTLTRVSGGFGGSWNAQGVILFSQGDRNGLARIAATGGAATQLTRLQTGAIAHVFPTFLSDGRRFVYGVGGLKDTTGIYLGSLDGTAPIRLRDIGGSFTFLPSGWLLVWDSTQHALVAQRLDVDKAALVGAAVTLANGDYGAVSASATGLVAYWRGAVAAGKRQLQWRARTGGDLGSIGEPDETYATPRVAPDGRRVAVHRGEGGKGDIWLLEGQRASRLTFDAAGNVAPVWSPDGKRITFFSQRTDGAGTYLKSVDGTGEEQLLLLGAAPTSWSVDGRYLMDGYLGSGVVALGVIPMTGDRKPRAYPDSKFFEGAGEFSPDGKWVAYISDESGRMEVYISPFVVSAAKGAAAHSGKWQVSTAGGTMPKWSADGKELYFLDPQGDMMAAPIALAGSALTPGTSVKLFHAPIVGGGQNIAAPEYDVARDGRFLINVELESAAPESSPIILIQNWNPLNNQ
jgi:eukaryotic-like serine/threonine-protein kinase